MKILSSIQLKELDQYTIDNEPIESIDLMERAAEQLVAAITRRWDTSFVVKVFAGPGNNGGDALAVARMLSNKGYGVEVFLFNTGGQLSEECHTNLQRLKECGHVYFTEITTSFTPPTLTANDLVVDGLFGSGLNRPLGGGFAAVIKYINASPSPVVSIDIPSGLMGEDNTFNNRQHIIHADVTLSIQLPKLAFLFPENEEIVGEWELLDIGLQQSFIDNAESPYHIMEHTDIQRLLKKRKAFAHKGTFGHGLLIAGKYGMAGASIMASKACIRSGIGLLTVHVPINNHNLLQLSVPEAITHTDVDQQIFAVPEDTDNYQAVAIGPGIGQEEDTALALKEQLQQTSLPMILDADALNILSSHRNWLSLLTKGAILTPHIGELERLVGKCTDSFERLRKAKELAVSLSCYIIVKGHYSTIVTPDGRFFFNPTGNAGMATAGSGDVLTGILLALAAQGYSAEDTCKLGVYVHGLAGDLAAVDKGEIGMTAGDMIEALPYAWKKLAEHER
ncbi:MAG: NAD(P)H-hydrate dehydratase [Phocaeicola sp.]|nr:NAD(P)H-hydrate dehydratase [Phocaeicola sp.]